MGCKDIPKGWKNKEMSKNVGFQCLWPSFGRNGLFGVALPFSRTARNYQFPAG
jgi:hypothetical protein